MNIAHFEHRRALRTLIIVSAERLKSLFVQAKFTRKLCVWATHVPNENNSAIVLPTITGEGTLHIVITLSYFTTVCNVCKMVKFTMV